MDVLVGTLALTALPLDMTRTTRRAMVAAAAACGLLMLGRTIAVGQAPASPSASSGKGAVIGTGAFTSFVENMDRSLAFYHDAFGMEVPPLPASGERPYNNPNPRLFAMFDIAAARERHQSARVPGTRISVELMEIQNVDHQRIPMRSQDPGTATLVLMVRDLDAALVRARQAGAEPRRVGRRHEARRTHGGFRGRRGCADSAEPQRRARRRPESLLSHTVRAMRRLRLGRTASIALKPRMGAWLIATARSSLRQRMRLRPVPARLNIRSILDHAVALCDSTSPSRLIR